MPFMLPLVTLFIMSRACLNCLIIRLTSTTGRPDPAAIRRLLLGFKISGSSRSCSVIEETIALTWAICFLSILTFFN